MSQKRVLMIDDEMAPTDRKQGAAYMWYYAQALRDAGLEIKQATTIDEAIEIIKQADEKKNTFNLIVLDVMMPPGTVFANTPAVKGGRRTGDLSADLLAELCPNVGIVVLTIMADKDDIAALTKKPTVRSVLSKVECMPFDFRERVLEILSLEEQ